MTQVTPTISISDYEEFLRIQPEKRAIVILRYYQL